MIYLPKPKTGKTGLYRGTGKGRIYFQVFKISSFRQVDLFMAPAARSASADSSQGKGAAQ